MRIHELAKKYKITSEEMLDLLRKHGFTVKSHMSGATDEITAFVEKKYAKKKSHSGATSKKTTPKKSQAKAVKKSTSPSPKAKGKAARAAQETPKATPQRTAAKKKEPAVRGRTAGKAHPAGSKETKTSHGVKRTSGKSKVSALEKQQKAVRESVRRTLAKLEATRRTKRKKQKPREAKPAGEDVIRFTDQVSVKELSNAFGVDSTTVIRKCMALGITASVNQMLDNEMVELLAEEFDKKVEFTSQDEGYRFIESDEQVDPSKLRPRPPVVTVMGHVDHGKTSILDYIRKTTVAEGEAGGITQHVGAYEVEAGGGKITFIDTPGHEAFTAMRARGADVTDIVVLVVASDDGVMPQTVEAINHAHAARAPIIVAINKIDLPGANPETVKQQLADRDVLVEDFGGDVLCQEVSAKTGRGINKLLESILLQAELLELRAVDEGPARGVVIEVKKEHGRGILCTIIIKSGALRVGDHFVVDDEYGKVRAILDHMGNPVKSAGPSKPVLVLGCNGLPHAGTKFIVVNDEKTAREISLKRQELSKASEVKTGSRISLEELYSKIQQGELKELKIIVKGDTNGSVEALVDSLSNLATEDVKVQIIHSGVGFITESDVLLAASSSAIIVGFNVKSSPKAAELAEKEHVEIRMYNIIYECLSEMKDAIEGLLEPEMVEKVLGRAEVRKVFKISRLGTIAGSMVLEGKISRNSQVRVIRDGEAVFEGKITSLKRFQEDVKDVQKDFECGIGISGFNDIHEGDILETFIIEQKSKMVL